MADGRDARVKPLPLRPGDGIRLVAPCGVVPEERFRAGVAVLESWGYRPAWDARVLDRDGYLAGPDGARAEEFCRAFQDGDEAGVWTARGGYGALRILDEVAGRAGGFRAKPFVGFSDATALHVALLRAGRVTFHGLNVTTLAGADPESLRRTRAALSGADPEATFAWEGLQAVAGGRAQGTLVAGNLSLVAAMMGTRHGPPLGGAILVLEDAHEAPYRLDRLLTQVALAEGPGPAGVVLGDLGEDGDGAAAVEASVRRFAQAVGVPVVRGFPAGHRGPLHPVPLGVRAALDADAGTLRLLEDPYRQAP